MKIELPDGVTQKDIFVNFYLLNMKLSYCTDLI